MNIKKSVLISLAFMSVTTTVYGKDISVRLNGNDIGTSAIIEADRSFVPYRAVFEKLGYTVEWNDRRITAKNKDTEMILAVGSSLVQISKNGETTAVDCGNNVILRNDRTYVPLRFVAENSGYSVEWSGEGVDLYSTAEIPEYDGKHEREIKLDMPIACDAENEDFKYISEFIRRNIDENFDINKFAVYENSSVNVGGITNLSILSLKYKLNDFRTDSGYDFYIFNNEAIKLVIMGNPLCNDEEFPDIKYYSDEELKQMALEEIKLYKNEVVEKQRVLKKYKDGKYVYGVVTEIINTASNIGRAEYFEIEG
ncbi:MAG: hypothetical protein EGQ35_08365 [Clostridiales bacterium]|nr:hypothetical protein [Clostridiales bacterium]